MFSAGLGVMVSFIEIVCEARGLPKASKEEIDAILSSAGLRDGLLFDDGRTPYYDRTKTIETTIRESSKVLLIELKRLADRHCSRAAPGATRE